TPAGRSGWAILAGAPGDGAARPVRAAAVARQGGLRPSRPPVDLRHDLVGEDFLFLLDTFAELEADVTRHPGAGGVKQLADGLVGVLDERLADEGDLFQVLGELAFDHLLYNVVGLAALLCLLREHLALAIQDLTR